MSDEQYEVALEGIKLIEKKEPVLEASMSITNGGCIVASSSGAISMHRCWAKPGADVGSDEIFSICMFLTAASTAGNTVIRSQI